MGRIGVVLFLMDLRAVPSGQYDPRSTGADGPLRPVGTGLARPGLSPTQHRSVAVHPEQGPPSVTDRHYQPGLSCGADQQPAEHRKHPGQHVVTAIGVQVRPVEVHRSYGAGWISQARC